MNFSHVGIKENNVDFLEKKKKESMDVTDGNKFH